MADQTFQNVINGELVDAVSGETYDVIDPTTGEVYAQAPMSGAEDVDRAYRAAASAFEAWGEHHSGRAAAALLKIADALEARADEFVRRRVQGHRQAARADRQRGAAAVRRPAPLLRRRRPGARGRSAGEYMTDHTSFIRREPIGVVGQVTPWNYPLMMMIWKIAPALAAGNTVVLKPSDTTPASSTLLAELAPGVPAAGRAQRRLRRPGHRPRAGRAPDAADGRRSPARCAPAWRSPASAAADLKRVHLELGGKAPVDRLRRRRHREGRRGRSPRPATSTPARTAPRPPACWPGRASTTTSSPR